MYKCVVWPIQSNNTAVSILLIGSVNAASVVDTMGTPPGCGNFLKPPTQLCQVQILRDWREGIFPLYLSLLTMFHWSNMLMMSYVKPSVVSFDLNEFDGSLFNYLPSAGKRWCFILSYLTASLNLDCANAAQPETEAKLNKHFLTGGNTCPHKPLPVYTDLLNKKLDKDIGSSIAGVVLGDSVNAVDEKFCRSTAVLHVACWASSIHTGTLTCSRSCLAFGSGCLFQTVCSPIRRYTSGSLQTARPLNCRMKTCCMLGPLCMHSQ